MVTMTILNQVDSKEWEQIQTLRNQASGRNGFLKCVHIGQKTKQGTGNV